jgi:2-hydroxyacyl-CoA lyase 1
VPKFVPLDEDISKAFQLLKTAKNPLVIIGKGAAYSRAEKEVTEFINRTHLPFLPTPLGKGVVPDSHKLNVSAARSTALGKADLVLLVGARFNWILHFGHAPRFDPNVKVIQIDIEPEEMSHNVSSQVQLVGDCREIFVKLNKRLDQERWEFPANAPWNDVLGKKVFANSDVSNKLMLEKKPQMTYYTSGRIIKAHLPKDCTLIGEGANTMDIGRTIFTHEKPLRRLDAGSFGTMGIGIPFVLAAKAHRPTEWVVAVMGDSAFGFSAMELETLTRYKLGAVIFIINNNGIYSGVDKLEGDPKNYPVTGLNPDIKYELIGSAFCGEGIKVQTEEELEAACKQAFKKENINKLIVINVAIEATSEKKPQEHAWLTRDEPKSKL